MHLIPANPETLTGVGQHGSHLGDHYVHASSVHGHCFDTQPYNHSWCLTCNVMFGTGSALLALWLM